MLGTGGMGNSIFYGIMSSARTSLILAVICAAINMTVGILVGAVWGYSKRVDAVMLVIYNIIANVPYILLISVLVYIIGSGFWPFVFALTVTGWLGIAYFFRTQVMIIRDREYSLASRCLGTPVARVISKNILPFLTSVIVTLLATELPSYISMEVFLSYIGIGLSADVPSLGRMIQQAQTAFPDLPLGLLAAGGHRLRHHHHPVPAGSESGGRLRPQDPYVRRNEMAENEKKVLLSLKNVEVKFNVRGRILTAIRRVSLDIYENEALAIVGESGSGKSVLTKTFAGMLDSNGFIPQGTIIFSDDEISKTDVKLTPTISACWNRAEHAQQALRAGARRRGVPRRSRRRRTRSGTPRP